MRTFLGCLLAGLVLLGFVLIAPFCQPLDRTRATQSSLTFLRGVDAASMQQLFPEGELFTATLAGLAAGNLHRQGQLATPAATDQIREALDVVDSDEVRDRFGKIDELEHGTFYRGWRLLLLTELARLDGSLVGEVAREARTLATALSASRTFPDSYPGGYWPCDAVVALAAIHRANDATGGQIPSAELARLTAKLRGLGDTGLRLLPHKTTQDGLPLEGPRATSSSLIAAFLPDIDAAWARDYYAAFRATFLTSEVGLVGIREYPRGVDGGSDEDTGPLVFGVSASASAVALAAARRMGDEGLVRALDGECDLLGFPLDIGRGRRHWFGVLPVGDAFVAWARSYPRAAALSPAPATPVPWPPILGVLLSIPAATALWGLWRTRGRGETSRRRGSGSERDR